jgi:signal transduction histidine kinase
MTIRLRLALWYSALAGLVFLILGLVSYAFHIRAHYDELDLALASSADHAASEVAAAADTSHLISGRGALDIALRLYDETGGLRESLPPDEKLPPVSPQGIIAKPVSHSFEAIANLVPSTVLPSSTKLEGSFGLITTQDQRWRTYVRPVEQTGRVIGYVEAITSLHRLDDSMRAFRQTLLILGAASLIAVFLISWATASGALRPISTMVESARSIARLRDFSHRVEGSSRQDELYNLAGAFNEMLTGLEESYRAQQRFVSDASHELRAPLTAIQANLELLQRQRNLSLSERQEALDEASREAHRLTRLVADLLVLARADTGMSLQHKPVELDRIVLEAVAESRHLTQGQKLEVDHMNAVSVSGDEDRLKQLILIMLDNAIKYTPPEGRITTKLQRDGASVTIRIRDNGVGIPAEALPHVFERFYRADPARRRDPAGTGLGLAIAQWIVLQHGGMIHIDSQPGNGTSVTITLPILIPNT